ncbi:MAG: homocysteine S-methyltransferase family protein [Deltaproteobacteria bacterium]|jgi:5-methyltetrahydrofolate--homocysteine methyltransferase|nr:homocysteine S-methyltransferase family protein [Deltaproteobacteria bacterium]
MTAPASDFRQALADLSRPGAARLYFDGGMGTMLQRSGLPAGMAPELFCLERPEVLLDIHRQYIRAGADVILTNTFGGSPFKLPAGLAAESFNRRMAEMARQAAKDSGKRVFVAGDIGPTGKFLQPLGEVSFAEMLDALARQIHGLVQGGVDLLLIETQMDLAEARAGVIAARQVCDLPIAVTMTYEDGLTLTGSTPEVCVAALANMGVDMIGTNCSAGPIQMADTARRILAASPVPVLVEPNAGLPELINGKTVFRLDADTFAELSLVFAESGVAALGGCCGTTPEHIAALRRKTERIPTSLKYGPSDAARGSIALTSRSSLVQIGRGHEFALIGERINPTGKKDLAAELAAGESAIALRFASEQLEAGASVLDVNVGAPRVDEVKTMSALVKTLVGRHLAPLALDSSNPAAIRAALEYCPGSALINSISGEEGRMELLGPMCRDFGAPFVLLPLRGRDLPVSALERIKIIEALLKEMDGLNIPRRLAIVDGLALSISAKPEAAAECLKFIRYCAESLNMPTLLGLSNLSFGLPARELINAGFLTMAAGAGLNAAIANPGNARIREALAVSRLLLGQDKDAENFLTGYSDYLPGNSSGPSSGGASNAGGQAEKKSAPAQATLEEAVVRGLREEVPALVDKALENGLDPLDIVNGQLIPGISEVGRRYECKEYYLPQLLRSAETMQLAFEKLRPLLEKAGQAVKRSKIVTATVEGDIHDIGKNIVNLMLNNHGFEVIDLGKDVSAERIVRAAEEHQATLIALSALMTTTMVRMKDTMDLLKARKLHNIKVMIGGAVVTEAFAEDIGAHGFALDAVSAVKVAKELLH